MKKLNAAIIGAGKIGAFFDKPTSSSILTHAHGYFAHPKFNIVGFADTNYENASNASRIWGGRPYKNIEDLFSHEDVDVVSVCVPDEQHYSVIRRLKKYPILGGILEKPLTDNVRDSLNITKDSFFSGRIFLVNYHRRFVPEFEKLAKKIRSGDWGKFVSGSGYYGKGLLHNGSHLLDLLLFFGLHIKGLSTISKINDFFSDDPSYSAIAYLENGKFITLSVIPSKLYKIFEIELCFEMARIKILEEGFIIEEYYVKEDLLFKNSKKLFLHNRYKTSLDKALYFTIDNLYNSIFKKKPPICTIRDGYDVQKLCSSINQEKA